jgi:hypothetical protein
VFFRALNEIVGIIIDVGKIAQNQVFIRKDIALLLTLTVDAEAASVLPNEKSVPTFPVHLLDGGRPPDVFFRQDPNAVIDAPVLEEQADLAYVVNGQFHT